MHNYEEHYNDDYDYQNSVDYDVTGEQNDVKYLADFNQIDKVLEPPRFQKRQEIFRTIGGNSVSILSFFIITKIDDKFLVEFFLEIVIFIKYNKGVDFCYINSTSFSCSCIQHNW